MFYQKHLFFCTNQRNGKACCQDHQAQEMLHYAKDKIKSLGLPASCSVRANASGCLGRCELGPVLLIYPEGIWYTYHSKADIDTILNEHILNGRVVERLRLADKPPV